MKILGGLLAAVPFAFAGIRLLTTGNDARYLWLAIASTICAAAVLVRRGSPGAAGFARTAAATIAAAAGAAAVALLLGARAGPGIAIVAAAFGLCSGIGTWFALR